MNNLFRRSLRTSPDKAPAKHGAAEGRLVAGRWGHRCCDLELMLGHRCCDDNGVVQAEKQHKEKQK